MWMMLKTLLKLLTFGYRRVRVVQQTRPQERYLPLPGLQPVPAREDLEGRVEGVCGGGPSHETSPGNRPPVPRRRGESHRSSFEAHGRGEPGVRQPDHRGRRWGTPLLPAWRGVPRVHCHRWDRRYPSHAVEASTHLVTGRRSRRFRLPLPNWKLGGPPAEEMVGDDLRSLRLPESVL